MILVDLLIATLVLWLLYIPAATLVNKHKEDRFVGLLQFLVFFFVSIFYVLDVLFNYTYACILFMDKPRGDDWTLTARLKYYLHTPPWESGWRGRLASFMCRYMIEPWDFGHCSL